MGQGGRPLSSSSCVSPSGLHRHVTPRGNQASWSLTGGRGGVCGPGKGIWEETTSRGSWEAGANRSLGQSCQKREDLPKSWGPGPPVNFCPDNLSVQQALPPCLADDLVQTQWPQDPARGRMARTAGRSSGPLPARGTHYRPLPYPLSAQPPLPSPPPSSTSGWVLSTYYVPGTGLGDTEMR